MSWGAQNRSKDAKTPSAAPAMSRKPELALCGIQPYALLARMLPFRLGAHRPVSGSSGRYVLSKGVSYKNRVRGHPSPPMPPPFLGMLGRSSEGLPGMRNWPFRLPLSPISPPSGTQGNTLVWECGPPAGRGGGFGGPPW
jgi:hypothetical protein